MSAQMQDSLIPVAGTIDPPRAMTVTTPNQMLAMAIDRGADLSVIEKFMDLQDRWEAKQALNAFTEAFAAFKADPPMVLKDKENKQYGSMYATLGNLVNTCNEALGKHGLTARWDVKQGDGNLIEVTCILTHVLGHSERVTMRGGPDTSGSKNALQQIKSTTTYLRGATFEAVTGIATSERLGVNPADDGNGAGDPQTPTKAEIEAQRKADEAELAAKRKAQHDEAHGRHSESITFIKDRLASSDLKAAIDEWAAIPEADQMALWLAATKGGCLTTEERRQIKEKKL